MSSNSGGQSTPPSRPLRDAILVTLVSMIVAGGAVGGFFIGRYRTQDAFITRVTKRAGAENNTSLISAGGAPVSLFQVLGEGLDDPLTATALAKLYDIPLGDRETLARRLRNAAWLPAYQPAPFVGHMARPSFGAEPHINMLGFRDERQTYVTKPDRTLRIFITGGSTAWGSGASSQKNTISYVLEQMLNERASPVTGCRYEVVNTAFPAWSTTQEKLLIQQRLVDMHPDAVIMLSGTNDVHWALQGQDTRWFYTYSDQNYMMMLSEMYKASGHPEWSLARLFSSRRVKESEVGRMAARNVEEATFALGRVHAQLIFVLQPNIVSTPKRLTKYEQRALAGQDKPYWDSSYQALRDTLGGLHAGNYRLLDLSRSFGDLDQDAEMFIDCYHFGDRGSRLIAQVLAEQIDWPSIKPGPAVIADPKDALSIVSLEPTEWPAGKPFHRQGDGTSLLRLVASRSPKNLVVVFDRSVLPTVVADNVITASIPASRYATKGDHTIYVADAMTGETSPPVVFHSR